MLKNVQVTAITINSDIRTDGWTRFDVSGLLSPDLLDSMTVSMGLYVKHVHEIGSYGELFILQHMQSEIANFTIVGIRCALVINTTHFPVILSRIDTRDLSVVVPMGTNEFDDHLVKVWSSYEIGKVIPTINVNTDIPRTGIKVLPIKQREEIILHMILEEEC